jgi:hypothetical protein
VTEFPGGVEVSSRLDRAFVGQAGSPQRLYVMPEQMQLFDPQTTLSIPRPQTDLQPDHRSAQLRPSPARPWRARCLISAFEASLSIDLKDAQWARFYKERNR